MNNFKNLGDITYLVYENWQADKKVVVHKNDCSYLKDGLDRLEDYTGTNDRWYGPFKSLNEAITFATLFPNRKLKLCKHCLETEKKSL
jgi:hypothetical protein